MKPFKTHRQQLKILRDRGLIINDGSIAMRVLERENYYSLVNGYKDLFLAKDVNGQPVNPERYINGSSFSEIHELYCFDRELRSIVLDALLKFESSIKSKISYRFSEMYKEQNAFLHMHNYSSDPTKIKQILQLIVVIANIISKKSEKKNHPIRHYIDKHNGVPLWVLVNFLTLGNIQNFYECLDTTLQNTIAKDFSDSFCRDYRITKHITPEMIVDILKTSTLFRNVCAHEERLFSYRLNKPAKSSSIARAVNLPVAILKNGNLFTVVVFLKLVISKKDYKNLITKIVKLTRAYDQHFSSVQFQDILRMMGFAQGWEQSLN